MAASFTLSLVVFLAGCQSNKTTFSPFDFAFRSSTPSVDGSPPVETKSSNVGLVSYQANANADDIAPRPAPETDFPQGDRRSGDQNAQQAKQEPGTTSATNGDESIVQEAEPSSSTLTISGHEDRQTMTLDDVLDSVADCYPLIQIAIGELESAEGKVLSSWGEFDSVLSAQSISHPLGFYKTYRNGIGGRQPLINGGEIYGGYQIGDGNFEPWYGERETNEGGEFKTGFSIPLLKDRSIDRRRAALWSANLQREQLDSNVEARLLQFQRFATQAFWEWVATGKAVETQKMLLELANKRVSQIAERVKQGDLATIAQIDNDRFIAKRKSELVKAERKFEKAAIKLSLFIRDQNCSPLIAGSDQIPSGFPEAKPFETSTVSTDIATAISVRPEVVELDALRKQVCVDLNYGRNLIMPKLDVKGFAAQDIGGAANSKGDKTPFQLQLGVYAEVPLQRREGNGKIKIAQGKLVQVDAKRKFLIEKITAEIQDASSAVNAAFRRIELSNQNVELNLQSLGLARKSFEAGDIDLISLNIYETAVADANLQLIEAQVEYLVFQTVYETAMLGTAF